MSKEDTLKKINTVLKDNVYVDNILQYYDNVTYNIRFYMLNQAFQKEITEIRDSDDVDLKTFIKRLPDTSKIIIAETGVSSKINIKNLTLKALYPSTVNSNSVATYELNLYLQEIGSASLINQITAVSKLVGYDCYLLQPFHVDLWFSGYEQATGKPVQIIEDKFYTFEVTLSDVKTTTSSNGMEYNFTMIPTAIGDFNKSNRLMIDIGEINFATGTFGNLLKLLEKYINEKFIQTNPKIAHNYNDKIKYFEFDKGFIKPLMSKNSLAEMVAKRKINYKTPGTDDRNTIDRIQMQNFLSSANTNDSIESVSMRADNNKTLDDLLQDAILCSDEYKDHVLRLNYKIHNLKIENGQMISQIKADIILTENAYLKYYNKANELVGNNTSVADIKIDPKPIDEKNKNNKNKISDSYTFNKATLKFDSEKLKLKNTSQEDEFIDEMVENELYSLLGENRLQKRYEWQFNGRETSLLEFQSTLDKLWFANIPLYNVEIAKSGNGEIPLNKAIEDTLLKYKTNITNDKKYDDFINFINYTNSNISGVRGLAEDKRLYLDDIYYCIDETARNQFLSGRTIVEKCDLFSDIALEAQNNNLNLGQIVAKTGYENVHNVGNLVELNLKILGDPYWLGPIDDGVLYGNMADGECGKFDNIAFRFNATLDEKPDGTYDIENMVEFSNIYNVIESTSIFEEGKFIQNLRCLANMAFIHFPRLGV